MSQLINRKGKVVATYTGGSKPRTGGALDRQKQVALAIMERATLSDWEYGFMKDITDRLHGEEDVRPLTERQDTVLMRIYAQLLQEIRHDKARQERKEKERARRKGTRSHSPQS